MEMKYSLFPQLAKDVILEVKYSLFSHLAEVDGRDVRAVLLETIEEEPILFHQGCYWYRGVFLERGHLCVAL